MLEGGRPRGRRDGLRGGTELQEHSRKEQNLDPQSMENNCLSGCFWWFWAIILHTFGVQQAAHRPPSSWKGSQRSADPPKAQRAPQQLLSSAAENGTKSLQQKMTCESNWWFWAVIVHTFVLGSRMACWAVVGGFVLLFYILLFWGP